MEDYNKSIDEPKKVKDIRAEPLDIPAGFRWCNVNIIASGDAASTQKPLKDFIGSLTEKR